MPYPPSKTENYHNIGGVNRKASPFMTGLNEVIDILNFDFTNPGSYTTRPGSTYFPFTFVTFPSVGGFPPITNRTVSSFIEFTRLSGASFRIANIGGNVYTHYNQFLNSEVIRRIGYLVISDYKIYPNPLPLSMIPFVDRLFISSAADQGSDFFKTDGSITGTYNFSLPGATVLGTFINTITLTGHASAGWTGYYQYGFCWLNERGYIGPVFDRSTYPDPNINRAVACIGASRTTAVVFNFVSALSNYVPDGFGITAMVVFRSGVALDGIPGAVPGPKAGITYLSALYDLAVIPLSSTSFTDNGQDLGPLTKTGNTPISQSLWFTLCPKYLETYNNSLFMAGFASFPSTCYFSAIGEPELVGATQSFEVRTNDGDVLTGEKAYNSQLILFKNKSFHSWAGDTPSNYSLREISRQYGCVSNRAIIVYNDLLLFLDRKGICEYNGAGVQIISNRVEATFRRMNLNAAQNNAIMLHVKDRNEIWTVFPIDNSTVNNYIVVYDYVANAFSEWAGPQIASMGLAFDLNQNYSPFFGDFSAAVNYFNPSLWTDSGRAFTCSVTPRYFGGNDQEMGYSVEKMFRRAYFDVTDSLNTGQTNTFVAKFYSDFIGGTIVGTQTFCVSNSMHQQPRLDFGFPGKAMTFQLAYVPQTAALNFNGYTIEYRYQRNV